MGTIRDAEYKVILELTELLNRNAEKVKSGETNVCLTTSSLSILSVSFRRYSESRDRQEGDVAGPSNWVAKLKQKKSVIDQEKWKENVRALFDFVIKIKSLKIINGSNTLKAPVQIARFKALQVLEIKKVPIHMVEGLSKLRGQLKDIIVTRSAQTLQDVLEICGGDRSSGFVWTNLKSVYVSFNGFKHLDNSLRFIPFVEVLDLSHNNIHNTEDFLQHLTDISKINFGYNMLSIVPQFSYSNKGKLKTLVLRNNNLDNLEGIEELPLLEEIDISENCLIEHSVLHVLSALGRLRVLWLVGNPLYYASNHRVLTLKYTSPTVRLGEFLLDGLSLSADEVFVARKNKYNRGSDHVDSTINVTEDPPSAEEPLVVPRFSRQEQTGNQLSPNTSHSKKKKRGHRRVKSRERIPKIADISDSESYAFTDDSPVGSSKEEETISAQIEIDKRKIEIMRKHYKDDWLKALSADRKKSSDVFDVEPPRNGTDENKNLDESVQKDFTDSAVKEVTKEDVKSNDPEENDQKIMMKDDDPMRTATSQATPPTSEKAPPTVIKIEQNTDIYMFSRMASIDSLLQAPEPVLKLVESYEQYGEESDPFIVMLPEDDMSHLIVTVNNRYIIEKNLNGEKREALDLKFLKDYRRSEEQLSGPDIVWGVSFTVVTLKFDYARKDMRERRYAMEDEAFADKLESLLSGHLKKEAEELVECLKCQQQFPKTSTVRQSGLPTCPKCNSKMLIKVEPSTGADQSQETSAKRSLLTENKSDSPKISPRTQRRSNKGSERKPVDSKILSPDMNESHHASDQSSMEELKPNSSWSDVQRAAVSARGSVSSVESDITILASHSNKSNASISELSQESLLESESEHLYSIPIKPQHESDSGMSAEEHRISTSVDIQAGSLIKENSENFGWMKDKKELLTPVGSPLSNSVCSSMVSSVYENTLPSPDKQLDNGSGEPTPDSSFTSSSTESLSVRHRASANHRPKSTNRNVVLCSNSREEFDSYLAEVLDKPDGSNGTIPSLNVSESDNNTSSHSIYDSVSEKNSMDKSHDFSETSSDVSHTDDNTSHSSPLKRKGSARKSHHNRSAIYSEAIVEDYESSGTFGLSPDTLDLSPIKRTGSGRASGRNGNRSAVVMTDQAWPAEESIFKDTTYASDESKDNIKGDVQSKDSSFDAKPLPWEEDVADKPLGGVNLDEFRNVDHRVQLYLELKVFQAEEVCQCAIQCDIVQYMKVEPVRSLMVISSHRILIFEMGEEQQSDASSDWLKCYEDQPIAELRYIDIGLGYQSLRIEFNTMCSSYTLLIADESRCKNFLALITDIVHSIDHSSLEGISKSNPTTLANIDSDILLISQQDEEIPEEDRQVLVRYLLTTYTDEDSDSETGVLMGLAVTTTDIILIEENYQWPLPRLQAPLSESMKKKQFTVFRREKINNIESLMFNEYNPRELRLSFFETSDASFKSVWMISMETTGGVKTFVDAIRNPWEEEFGVTLDVTSTSFTDESNTSKQ